jgi:hypothetical protein
MNEGFIYCMPDMGIIKWVQHCFLFFHNYPVQKLCYTLLHTVRSMQFNSFHTNVKDHIRCCRNGSGLRTMCVLESTRNKLLGKRDRKLNTINTRVCRRKRTRSSYTHFLTSQLSFIKSVSVVTFNIPLCLLDLALQWVISFFRIRVVWLQIQTRRPSIMNMVCYCFSHYLQVN